MLGNKEIMGENIKFYMDQMRIDRRSFAKAIGVPYSSLTDWINGKTYPRIDKIQRMADFFGIEKADLVERRTDRAIDRTDGQRPQYYLDNEAIVISQELFENPDLRVLFDAARGAKPENLRLAAEMLRQFKEGNKDG